MVSEIFTHQLLQSSFNHIEENIMSKKIIVSALLSLALISGTAIAKNPKVGGAAMYPNKNIIQNAVNSPINTTLVAAVKAAGLVETLSGPGPFTVLAPTNAAFNALPAGTVETLLKPENKATLTKILTCHVIAGNVMAAAIQSMVKADGGSHMATTVGGCKVTFSSAGGKVFVTDEKGNKAQVTIANVKQSNGVIHVINKVLLPN
jgi:uncharacterized surface protein with fasciclin (FAS1) repeats